MKKNPGKEAAEEGPFDYNAYLKEMSDNPQRALKLIAFYFKTKRLKFATRGEVQVAIRRHLRAAREVAEFEDTKIRAAFAECKKMEAEEGIKFTMETVVKVMTK